MSQVLDVAPGVETLHVDGEVLVFDGTMIHLLSGSGADIWALVDGRRTREKIVAALASRHSSVADLDRNVDDYLTDLLARGLIVESAGYRRCDFVASAHVAWVTDGTGVVLLHLLSGERHSLSSTASRVWLLLAQGAPRDKLLTTLAVEFPDAPPDFGSEVDRLCASLVAQGLLEPAP